MEKNNRIFDSHYFFTKLNYHPYYKPDNINNDTLHYFTDSENQCILRFIHIPKTAGSSISYMGHKIGWGKYFQITTSTKIPIMGSFWHIPIRYWNENPYTGFKLFTIVRNPYYRILSEFKHQLRISNILEIYTVTCDFFNEWIDDKFDMLQKYPHLDDNHFLPQSEFVFDKNNVQIIDHILHFEKLDEELEQLILQYDLKINSQKESESKLPHLKIGCHTMMTINDISDNNIDKINKYYADDFNNFGYDMFKSDKINRNFDLYHYITKLDYSAVRIKNFIDNMYNIPNYFAKSEKPFILQFVHIPKTAGSAISFAGKELGWGENFPILENMEIPNIGSYWHIPIRYWTKNPYSKFELFAIVRNPYGRILSEFKFQLNITDITERYQITSTFFNEWLVDKFDMLNTYPHLDNNHFLPQSEYIFNKSGNQIVRHILRFENLEDDFSKLMKQYNLDITLDHRNASYDCDIKLDDISSTNISKINLYYEQDFKNFGYNNII